MESAYTNISLKRVKMKITAKKRAKKFGKMNISTYICSHQR